MALGHKGSPSFLIFFQELFGSWHTGKLLSAFCFLELLDIDSWCSTFELWLNIFQPISILTTLDSFAVSNPERGP
jgi:hypothetical protein